MVPSGSVLWLQECLDIISTWALYTLCLLPCTYFSPYRTTFHNALLILKHNMVTSAARHTCTAVHIIRTVHARAHVVLCTCSCIRASLRQLCRTSAYNQAWCASFSDSPVLFLIHGALAPFLSVRDKHSAGHAYGLNLTASAVVECLTAFKQSAGVHMHGGQTWHKQMLILFTGPPTSHMST